jgi:hypothetical protein
MQCYVINPQTKEVVQKDIHMKANSVYSFFNSILIDELPSIREHIIYADGNALSEKKPAYFVGEQLVLGDALIVGVDEMMGERDVTIPKEDLASIINYEVSSFYKEVLELLSATELNLYRTFEVIKANENITLNTEWVLYTFDIADEATRNYFKTQLQQTIENKEDVGVYMQKMAQLAMNAAG